MSPHERSTSCASEVAYQVSCPGIRSGAGDRPYLGSAKIVRAVAPRSVSPPRVLRLFRGRVPNLVDAPPHEQRHRHAFQENVDRVTRLRHPRATEHSRGAQHQSERLHLGVGPLDEDDICRCWGHGRTRPWPARGIR